MTETDSRLVAASVRSTPGRRFVIAIAGPPAAGKSTLAEHVAAQLAPRAFVLGLDAYHFDDRILVERGHRDRKGSPHTFDVAAYALMLRTLRERPELEISVPVFDREIELSVNCAAICTPDHGVIVTEGNYLLLGTEPWSELAPLFDLTVFTKPPLAVLEGRIRQRWVELGLSTPQVDDKWQLNDRPNAELVLSSSRPADLTIS